MDLVSDVVHVNTNTTLPKATVLGFSDPFDRADGPLGVTWEGKPWQRFTAGAVGVSPEVQVVSNRATVVGGSGTTFVNYVADVGTADYVIDIDLVDVGSRAGGIILRGQSSNTWLAILQRQSSSIPGLTLVESNNGTRNPVRNSGVIPANGDHLRVIVRSTGITAIRNGTVIILNESSSTAVGYQRAGIHGDQAGVGMSYDNIRVQPL